MDKTDFKSLKNYIESQNFRLGNKIHVFENLVSGMITARDMALQGCPEGTVVIAEKQEAGRGRLGRNWSSPEGGLWMCIVLRPCCEPNGIQLITLAAGISVCKTVQQLYGLKPGLKWPNDVLINGKKICGILTEGSICANSIDFAILGIGVNLNFGTDLLPDELKSRAATLLDESGIYIEMEQFLYYFFAEMDEIYDKLKDDKPYIIQQWKEFSITLGTEVTALYSGKSVSGMAKDITPSGSLVIETGSGENVEIHSGEVTLGGKLA